jgi:hypothetical protein
MEGYDPSVANRIGHFTLALSAIACAVGFRRVPVFLWIAAYLLSAWGASNAWRKKPDLSPLGWLLGVALCGGLTALCWLDQSWVVSPLYWIASAMLALISASGFTRALYMRYLA